MRIVVTGSRGWKNAVVLRAILEAHRPAAIGVGDCPTGADKMAYAWAQDCAYKWKKYKAHWDEHGRAAGPLRNRTMLDDWEPELVIAFKLGRVSKGTDDCIKAAQERFIPVLLIQDSGALGL